MDNLTTENSTNKNLCEHRMQYVNAHVRWCRTCSEVIDGDPKYVQVMAELKEGDIFTSNAPGFER